jgi:hypothetical protein
LPNQLAAIPPNNELESPCKLEMAKVRRLDFKMVAVELLLVPLRDGVLWDSKLDLNTVYGDIRVTQDAFRRHVQMLPSVPGSVDSFPALFTQSSSSVSIRVNDFDS